MPWKLLLNGNEAQINSQLQHWNQAEILFLCNSEDHEYTCFKFSRILFLIGRSENKIWHDIHHAKTSSNLEWWWESYDFPFCSKCILHSWISRPNLITLLIGMRTMTSMNDNSREVYATPGLTSSSHGRNWVKRSFSERPISNQNKWNGLLQRNNTGLSIWRVKQLLWLIQNQFWTFDVSILDGHLQSKTCVALKSRN